MLTYFLVLQQNFLQEHPDWETKWGTDREKARSRVGLDSSKAEPRRSRFQDRPPTDDNGDENGKSIRVQMRNTIKVDENRSDFISKSETTTAKDSGLDEWMGKPQKIALDIIDTQKFAEIVRQKHGNKLKEDTKVSSPQHSEPRRPSPLLLQPKERDSRRDDFGGGDRDRDRKRYDRVELQISSRENRERDRYNRDPRGGRRR